MRAGKSIEEIVLQRKSQSPENLIRGPISPIRNVGNRMCLSESPKYRDSEKEIIQSLLEHATALQERNKELEEQLLSCQNRMTKLLLELEATKARQGLMWRSDSAIENRARKLEPLFPPIIKTPPLSPSRPQQDLRGKNSSWPQHGCEEKSISIPSVISKTVSQMEEQILELRHMFDGTNPIHIRLVAATKIQAIFRGYWAHKKYSAFKKSFQTWRYGRSRRFLHVLEERLARAARIEASIRMMAVMRDYQLIVSVFSRWKHIYKQSAPFRLSIRMAAEEKYGQVMFGLKTRAFLALKNGTLGIDSHKYIRRERRKMVERVKAQIRLNLQNCNSNLLISEEEVRRAVHREIVTSSLIQRERRNKTLVFQTIKRIYLDSITHSKVAFAHLFKKYVGRSFYAWSDWIYQVGTGLERKRWAGPRKYEVRYNQKLVEHFSRTRLKKMTFRPWKKFTHVSRAVNHMYLKQLTRFVRKHLVSWRNLSVKYIYLRRKTLDNWMTYATTILSPPFFAWKLFASTATIRRMQQDSLANAYIRWKNRQKYIKILRTWRHQSLYGGIEGMYSRTNISRSLGEQKSMCGALQKLLSKQTVDLEESKDAVHKETILRKKMEDRVAERDVEIEILRLKIHHLDLELKRLHGIIDAMAVVNPKQINYIKSLQPEFEFVERKLQPSLDTASDEELFQIKDDKCSANKLTLSEFPAQTQKLSSSPDIQRNLTFLTPQQNQLSLEDRRLLARTKWLLKRLFPEPQEVNNGDANSQRAKFPLSKLDEVDEECEQKSSNQRIYITQLLKDLADRKEVIFILNLLSFLKDGNTKALGTDDCRSWTEELLQSVGRNPEIVSTILGQSVAEATHKDETSTSMENWRDILIQLRTNYPVGLVNSIQSFDHFDVNQNGTLNRVKSMRAELQEVIHYKINKLEASSAGITYASTLMTRNEQQILQEESLDPRNWSAINVYSQNLSSELGITKSDRIDDDFSNYDSLSLSSSQSPGILLNSELGFGEEFNLLS